MNPLLHMYTHIKSDSSLRKANVLQRCKRTRICTLGFGTVYYPKWKWDRRPIAEVTDPALRYVGIFDSNEQICVHKTSDFGQKCQKLHFLSTTTKFWSRFSCLSFEKSESYDAHAEIYDKNTSITVGIFKIYPSSPGIIDWPPPPPLHLICGQMSS